MKKECSQSSESSLQVKRRRTLYFGSEDYAGAGASALSNGEISSSILRSQVGHGSFVVLTMCMCQSMLVNY